MALKMGCSTINNKNPEDTEMLELWDYVTTIKKQVTELKAELAYQKGLILQHTNAVKAHYEGQPFIK